MLLVILVCIILVLLTLLLYHDWKFRESLFKLPGPRILPFLGNAHQIGSAPSGLLNFAMSTASMAPVTRSKFGPYLFIHITDPDEAEFVLTNQGLLEKSLEYGLLRDWLGDGLLISTGDKWRKRRKLLTPAFHFNILQKFVPTLEKQSRILMEKFESTVPHSVDIYPLVALCTLDIIAETAMGVQLNSQSNPDTEYVKAVKGMGTLLRKRLLSVIQRYDFIYKFTPSYKLYKHYLKVMHDLTRNIIKERRQILKKEIYKEENNLENEGIYGKKQRHSFLDTLILSETSNGKLSDEDIREEVDTFMFEGHDTTTSAISFILYCIAQNKEVQEKIYQEQVEIFEEDLEKNISLEDLNKMKYTEMVVKESLRLYPSVPIVMRRLPHDMTLSGTLIAEGSTLAVSVICQNRNPAVFKDPLKFIPERFSTEDNLKRHPFSYIPFSAGPRNCIGQRFAMLELKAVVSKVVRKFIITPGSEEPPELALELVLRSVNGIHVKFQKR